MAWASALAIWEAGTIYSVVELRGEGICMYVSAGGMYVCVGQMYVGHFLEILGISGKNGVQSWPPGESKSAEKTAHRPSGVISEVLPRVDFALPVDPRENL